MDQKAFFDRCFELNSQRIATNGDQSKVSLYVMEDELDHRVNHANSTLCFIKIKLLKCRWYLRLRVGLPGTKSSVQIHCWLSLLPVFKNWYGEGFKELDHESHMKKVYVKNGW
jgi:hypothetical protein